MSRTLKYGLSLLGAVTATNAVLYIAAIGLVELYSMNWAGKFAAGLVAAVVSATIITLGTITTAPVLRDYLATLRRLWRLENLSHPLLVRLSQEAPSTYHHSITVANLAHQAAKAIGADSIVARLGGYYHDIGKLANPDLYIENSPDRDLLETLPPQKAARMITGHVKEGLKLAKKYELPPEITAFITQHHGTTMASFFYEKAKAAQLNVQRQDFRYPGPKPLSKEAAIVMLADGVEAKLRALGDFNDKSVNQAVDSIIEQRVSDDQLELSGLTTRELRKIHQAFGESIRVMYHRRIKYPKDAKQ